MSAFLSGRTFPSTVQTADLADGAVTTAKLPDDAITLAKMADNAVGLAQLAGGTDGNLIGFDANGDPAAIATGSAGEVLTSGGAGVASAMAAAPSGGMTHLATVTASGTTAEITGLNSDNYNEFVIWGYDFASGSNPAYLRVYLGDAGGYRTGVMTSQGSSDVGSDTTKVFRGDYWSSENFGYSSAGEKWMWMMIGGTASTMPDEPMMQAQLHQVQHNSGSNTAGPLPMSGVCEDTDAWTKIKFVSSSGNFTGTAKFYLWGHK